MNLTYRQATIDDIAAIKELAIQSWAQYQSKLSAENWAKLSNSLQDDNTFIDLLQNFHCIVCKKDNAAIIGMAFLVSKGHPTEIYHNDWSYIRFVSVHPAFGGKGIGRKLTTLCIDKAKENGEKVVALHTSELMDKARYIYESLGFTIIKELDQRLGMRYWLYKLDLR